ncbi:hypothetical protein DFH07DRAFT_952483 [Mycena maculata]|uniref:Uncharacterized protein n=1 Tax=Mycena maculata TaxID=230809 RepID=A0AAD7NST5_9AGAR|nr:hypothetical protein DFH07DRAFT_952483 [Mycena maculata]
MTNHSRNQSSPAPQVSVLNAVPTGLGFLILSFPISTSSIVFPTTMVSSVVPTPAMSAAPAETPAATAPPATAALCESTTPAAAAAAATRTPAGAGLPAPLLALLRTEGPYDANQVYLVVPTEPLQPIEEEEPAPEWYAVTRGHFVGVVDQFALSAIAISGVAHAARKAYTTQRLALDAFNQALTWGGVQVV